MDLNGPIFDNIKIEADSDCAFFGLASVNDEVVPNPCHVGFTNLANNDNLNTLLSSVSPYTISSSGGMGSPKPAASSIPEETTGAIERSLELEDAIFSSELVEQLELDLPEFSCNFDILDDDDVEMSSALLREDSDSKDSGTSTTPDVYLGSPSALDSPPLTPPSPVIKVETEIKPGCFLSSIPQSVLPMLKNLPNGTNLTKILPSLKASRGRSASHDSPDVQALKRHIRMIRNRESASLSRKKKKEYVTNLEDRIRELETETLQLKQENQLLKTRLLMQQQQNGNLQNHSTSKINGTLLPNVARNSNKTKLIAKVALLGVCCFMVLSAHAPVTRNHQLNPEGISNASGTSKVLQNFAPQPEFPNHFSEFQTNHLRISRSLAWRDDFKHGDSEHHQDLQIPKKKLKNIHNGTLDAARNGTTNVTRTATLTAPSFRVNAQPRKIIKHPFHNVSLPIRNIADITNVPSSDCKMSFNKTESLRVQNDLKGLFSRGKPKKKAPTRPFFYSVLDVTNNDNSKGLTVYDQRMQRYTNFLEKIPLREDTFYVVSLAMDDQLLLSAKSSNSSSRPKMSFLMPWRNDSLGGKEEVMQIDCEVTKIMNVNAFLKAKRR